MNADPEVMEYFPSTLSRTQSTAMIERIETCFEHHSYGLWALELPGEQAFVGFAGLSPVDIPAPFAPAVEVGWRLARPFWGRGLATEAATAAITFGFAHRNLEEIVSFTAVPNRRSRAVMEHLGMRRDPAEDFDHPQLDKGHRLSRHVLYRLPRSHWHGATIARPRGS
jgi:ribosomal-protein-alanine N-acetyltransferase